MSSSFQLPTKYRNWALTLVGAGILSTVLGFIFSPTNVWISLHIGAIYFLSAALFGSFIIAVAEVSSAAWLAPYKSVAECMTSFLVPGGVLLIVSSLGGAHTLFEWTHAEAALHHPVLAEKQAYLNIPFFLTRLIVFVGLWVWLSQKLIKASRNQSPNRVKWAVIFLVVFAFTFSFASFDWIMSIEPHWYSTIFALYCFSGFFVAGVSCLTIAVFVLDKRGFLSGVINENHYHDLGKFLFGFSTFWAYIWLSQYLLIWYTNIPEETTYYLLRTHNDWDWLFYFNLVLNWIIPFFVLMPRAMKRNREVLLRVGICLLIGRWLDLFVLIAPKVFESSKVTGPSIGWVEVGIGLGFGGFFVLVCAAALAKHRHIPKEDVYFEEGLHLTQ